MTSAPWKCSVSRTIVISLRHLIGNKKETLSRAGCNGCARQARSYISRRECVMVDVATLFSTLTFCCENHISHLTYGRMRNKIEKPSLKLQFTVFQTQSQHFFLSLTQETRLGCYVVVAMRRISKRYLINVFQLWRCERFLFVRSNF